MFELHQDTARRELLHGGAGSPGGRCRQRDQRAPGDCQVGEGRVGYIRNTLYNSQRLASCENIHKCEQKLFKGGEISKCKKNYSRVEKAEERESKAQLLAKDLKTLQAENKSLVKKFTQSNKT